MFGQPTQNANKPICQYYQNGNCKFGNNCFNLHPGASIAKTNVFGGGSSSTGFSSFENNSNNAMQDSQFLEFVKQVIAEMKMWETNGLWQLSCLVPLKEHPPISAFIDTSPEELRIEAYQAFKSNNIASYQQFVNEKMDYHKQLRQALKNRNPDAIEVLKSVYYKTSATNPAFGLNSANMFGGNSSGSFLGSTSVQPSVFGGTSGSNNNNQSSSSLFGGTANLGANNVFGSKPQASAFGAAPVFGSNTSNSFGGGNSFKSVFGGQPSNTLFGGAANKDNQNVFGSSTQNSSSLFGGGSSQQQMNSSSNVFGTQSQGSNAFSSGSQNASNVFGGSTQQAQQAFGTSGNFGGNPNSMFGTSNLFNKNQNSSNVFGGSNNQIAGGSSLFGNTAQTKENTQPSMFGGGTSAATNNVFGGGNQVQSSAGSLFGGGSLNQTTTAATGGIFGNPIQNISTGGVFGNQGQNTNAGGIFGNQTQNANTGGIFGGGHIGQTTNTAGPFGNSSQNTSSGNIFGNTSQGTTAGGVFGNPNPNTSEGIFGNGTQTQGALAGNIFANNTFGMSESQSQQQLPPTTSSSIFGGNVGSTNGVFAGTTSQPQIGSNIFGSGNSSFVPITNPAVAGSTGLSQTTASSVFGSTAFGSNGNSGELNPFQMATQSGEAKPQVSNTNIFGVHQNTNSTSLSSSTNNEIYTPMHLLSLEDLKEFERDVFLKIPLMPPPRELCV